MGISVQTGDEITDAKIAKREVFPLFLYHLITEAMVDVVRCVWRARVRAVCARVFRTSGSVVHKSTVWTNLALNGRSRSHHYGG